MNLPRSASAQLWAALITVLVVGPTQARQMHVHSPECGVAVAGDSWAKDFKALRELGLAGAVAQKSMSPPDIGDRQEFKVYVYATNNFSPRTFELRDKTDLYYAWVEVNTLAQVSEAELTAIRNAMLTQTPSGSFDPAKGVISNLHNVFGSPPDVDRDGIVDFLFYDIDNQNVGGFVHPSDLNPDLGGNGKDVLHLDALQSQSFLPRLIAHEYTHLIHFNYESDVETFVVEGMAEYGMVLNGFTQDNFEYLQFPTEHKRPLFSWRGVDDTNGTRDYDRGRLFFSYVGERIGPLATGQMIRSDRKGAPGLDTLLTQNGTSLGDVVTDFHTANLVFDQSVDPTLGYSRHFSAPLSITPDLNYDTVAESDTGEGDDDDRLELEGGAVHYIRFGELADMVLNFDAFAPPAVIAIQPTILDDIRTRLRGRIVATRDDGGLVIRDVVPSPENFQLLGNYHEVFLIATSSNPVKTARYAADAGWNPFGSATSTEGTGLPDRFLLQSVYPNPLRQTGTIVVQTSRAGQVELYLIDAIGRRVGTPLGQSLSAGIHRVRLDTAGLAGGSYLLVAAFEGQRVARPIVIVGH